MRPLFAVLVIILAVSVPLAAQAGDAGDGLVLAKRWCASCHLIADDQKQGQDIPPPFSAIAKMPGVDAAMITNFLIDPHPRMPDMQLTRKEAEDLAAYIASMKR